jgi:hypothetical protein
MFWNKNKNRKELTDELIRLIEYNAPNFSTARLDSDRNQVLSIWNKDDGVMCSFKYFFEEHGYYVDNEAGEKIAKQIASYFGKVTKPIWGSVLDIHGGDVIVGYQIVPMSVIENEKAKENRYKGLKHC